MKAGVCVHFNGSINAACDAGISYSSFPPGDLPCIKKYCKGSTCSKRQEPSEEQIEQTEREHKEVWERVKTTRKYICEHIEKTGNASGAIMCSFCYGTVYYSQAPSNGHIHAKCSGSCGTSWME